MDLALDNLGVGDDLAIEVEDEMDAAQGVVPVLVGEPLVLARPERRKHQRADGRDLFRGQLLGR